MHRALAGPWKSLNFFSRFSRSGKSLKTDKVLESPWIWFSKTPWLNHTLILKKVFQMASFWPEICIKSIFAPFPRSGILRRLCMLIKVPVWFNLVFLIYPSYGPWKSLKSPWIWFWQMGKNPGYLSLDMGTTNIGWKYPIIQQTLAGNTQSYRHTAQWSQSLRGSVVALCDTSIQIVSTFVTIPVSPRSRYTVVYRSTGIAIPYSSYHSTMNAHCGWNELNQVTVKQWGCKQQSPLVSYLIA